MDKNNFYWLLLALLIFLFGVPVADDLTILFRPAVRALMFSCLLIIGVWSLKGAGRFFIYWRGIRRRWRPVECSCG